MWLNGSSCVWYSNQKRDCFQLNKFKEVLKVNFFLLTNKYRSSVFGKDLFGFQLPQVV